LHRNAVSYAITTGISLAIGHSLTETTGREELMLLKATFTVDISKKQWYNYSIVTES
jgi:hypothetical protein